MKSTSSPRVLCILIISCCFFCIQSRFLDKLQLFEYFFVSCSFFFFFFEESFHTPYITFLQVGGQDVRLRWRPAKLNLKFKLLFSPLPRSLCKCFGEVANHHLALTALDCRRLPLRCARTVPQLVRISKYILLSYQKIYIFFAQHLPAKKIYNIYKFLSRMLKNSPLMLAFEVKDEKGMQNIKKEMQKYKVNATACTLSHFCISFFLYFYMKKLTPSKERVLRN